MTDRDRGAEPDGVVGPDGRLSPEPRERGETWPTLPEPGATRPTPASPATPRPSRRVEIRYMPAPAPEEGPFVRFLKGLAWKLVVPIAAIPLFVIIGVTQCQSETERTEEIRELPGVIAVDNAAQRIVLTDRITRDQARRVVDRAYQLPPGWQLSAGVLTMELLKGRPGYEAASDLYRPLDVMLRLGEADLTGFSSVFLSLQAIPSVAVSARLSDRADLVPATRALVDAAAGQAEPLSVHAKSDWIAITQQPVPDSTFEALAELPQLASATLGPDGNEVTLRATPANADRTCRTAAGIFTAHRVTARLTFVTDPGPNPEPKPC